ncbi:MAG: hypothetical protein D6739_07405 [Nitrospirae bacterium]|nr:MAG: hypothetical protein D6739_07405 [Nitrospirota bacterium]
MYERHFGLKTNPFRIQANPEFLYLSPKHDRALATLEYGLLERKGFVVLVGEIGSGKTTLLNYVLGRLPEDVTVAFVFHTNLSKSEFLALVLSEFEVEAPEGDAERLNALYDFLLAEYQAGRRAVLMVDEAQNLAPEVLEQVRLLANLETGQQPLLQIILAGQPGLSKTLARPELEQLRQRVGVTYHLEPLDEEEVAPYIHHRLERAGAERLDLFEEAAYPLIYRHTRGVPRLINQLCDSALVAAYAEEMEQVTADLLEEVAAEQAALALAPEAEGAEAGAAAAEAAPAAPIPAAELGRLVQAVERLEGHAAALAARPPAAAPELAPLLARLTEAVEGLAAARAEAEERHQALVAEVRGLARALERHLADHGAAVGPRAPARRHFWRW